MIREKWFHISDILSVVTGITMSDEEMLQKPDGSWREAPTTAMTGYLDVVEHISQIRLRNEGGGYQKILHNKIIDGVYVYLRYRFEWIKDLEINQQELGGKGDVYDIRRDAFIREMKQAHGEWHLIKPSPVVLIKKSTFLGGSYDTNNPGFG